MWSRVTPVEAIQIFLFAAVSPLLMRCRLERVNAWISKPVPPRTPGAQRVARTIHLVDSVIRWGKPVILPGCVTRGLTLYYFLRKLGLEVALVFGAGQVDEKFAAHCWIERDDEPYLEKVDPRSFFVPVYRFGGLPRRRDGLV